MEVQKTSCDSYNNIVPRSPIQICTFFGIYICVKYRGVSVLLTMKETIITFEIAIDKSVIPNKNLSRLKFGRSS